jgi:hypothetical protein
MAYIIFNTEQEAELRSEQAGIQKGLSYHRTASGSRYWWGWSIEGSEENPRAFIKIKKNTWTDEETEEEHTSIPDEALLTDDDVLVDELPEDWVTASANPDGGGEEDEDPIEEDGND